MIRLPVAAAILLACACSASDQSTKSSDEPSAETQVNARLMQYPDAVKSGAADSIMPFFAEDVRVFEAEAHFEGASAIRKLADDFFGQNKVTRLAFAPSETVAHDSGTVVYQFGYYTEDFTPKAGGDTTNARANFVMRWVKDVAGAWRIHRLIAAPAPDSTAAPATVAPVAPVAGSPGDAASVEQRMRDYIETYHRGDIAAVKSFWAADLRLAEPGVEINDAAAITKVLEDALSANTVKVDLTSDEIFVHDNGSVAYQYGHYSERLTPKKGGAPTDYRMHFLARWKKDASGAWLIDRFYATPMPKQ